MDIKSISSAITLNSFRSDRSEFYLDLAEMYESGQSLRKFIDMQVSITNHTKQKSFFAAYSMILRRFDAGSGETTLSYLLEGIVPESDMSALVAIEDSGALRKHAGLRELAQAIIREKQLKMLIVKALAMPVFMIPFIGYLAFILADVVLSVDKSSPDFLKEAVFTGFNEFVRVLSIQTKNYGLISLISLTGLIIGFMMILPTFIGGPRIKLDSYPGFSLYRDFQSAKIFSSLAMLLESGKKLIPSLELIGSHGSRWSRWQIRRILGFLEESPTGYVNAFSMGVCSPYVEGRLTILTNILQEREARGDYKLDFSDVIVTVGKKEVEKTLSRIQKSSATLNAILLGVLFLYASILGIGSMTVPGKFAEAMEPSNMTILKNQYEMKKKMLHSSLTTS